jgi:putative NADPH-quinone reductase
MSFFLSFTRSQFEYEKNTNVKQVEQMRTMEMNLITMTKEAEKLRADVSNAEKRTQGTNLIHLIFYLYFLSVPLFAPHRGAISFPF